jgi:thiamine biosynthesis lipoprotein
VPAAATARGAAAALPSFEEQELTAMGGVAIRLRAWGASPGTLGRAIPRCQQVIEALEQRLSTFRESSFLSALNRAQGRALVADADSYDLVALAVRWARETRGAFDPTVGPLVDLWRAAAREGKWPSPEQVAATRARLGFTRVKLGPKSRTVTLEPTARLDLGAIAQGFMADRLVALLRSEGIERARIDVGGELRVYDDRTRAEPFRVGIRHPLRSGLIAEIELGSGAVATSGCYERFAQVGERRICHVIDPRSGFPAERALSATALAPDGADADALATALLVLGPAEGLQLAEALPGVQALIVTASADGAGTEVLVSAGLRSRVVLHAALPAAAPATGARD